jgi:hypothetical protein
MSLFETSDRRVVCGVTCTWWDDIGKVGIAAHKRGSNGKPLPCCPHCQSALYQIPSPDAWWATVLEFQKTEHLPGYVEFVWWLKGRCFASMHEAALAYTAQTGKAVKLPEGAQWPLN